MLISYFTCNEIRSICRNFSITTYECDASFENIATEDAVYTDKKNGKEFPTVVVVCNKPNRSGEERIEYKKESIIKKNKKIKYGK